MSDMEKIINESFVQYSAAVAQSRALVDARDGLKPSARQIFYCMFTDKFLPTKPFKKTLKAIGSAARMYIHGDASCEGVIMRAGQKFTMRYPLIEVEGNAGNLMLSGNYAAPRYTASRLSPICAIMFGDIGKNTIDEWRDNYDDTETYPAILPSKGYYNIVNGTQGIAVGLASSIPQYNLKEVNEALIKLLWNPDIDFDDIYCAPDFATGATLLNEEEVKESMRIGRGKACKLRATIEFDPTERCLIVTEIPFGVYTNTICGELEKILESDENPGIDRFNDLTGQTAFMKIYLTKKANVDRVIKYLYKNTSLQSHFGINFTMLDKGRYPRVFSWKEALQVHLDHEIEVYRRGYEYDVSKIRKRLHIIQGLFKAMDAIDEVIATIKSSTSSASANVKLRELLNITEIQAAAILDIKLSRLARMEITKLANEKKDLEHKLDYLMELLNDDVKLKNEVEKGLREIAQTYGDCRRTKVMNIEKDEEEEPVEIKSLQVSLTNKDNIYVSETSSLYAQRRGGVGTKKKLEKNECVVANITTDSNDTLMFFTNKGNLYNYRADALPIDDKIPADCLFSLKNEESIKALTTCNKSLQKDNIIFITKQGFIKKSSLSDYNTKKSNGIKALNIGEDDEIVQVMLVNDERVGILADNGNFIIIETKDIRPIGRVARGIRGIKLDEGSYVISAHLIPHKTQEILSVTQEGLSKRTLVSEFGIQARYTKGNKLHKLDGGKHAKIADFAPVAEDKEFIFVSTKACIRVKIDEFPIQSKGTVGVKSIKLGDNERIVSITKA